jgi:hypothetical protein
MVVGAVGFVPWARFRHNTRIQVAWTTRNKPDGAAFRSVVRVALPGQAVMLTVVFRGLTIRNADIRPVLPVGVLSTGQAIKPTEAVLTVQQASGTYVVTVWTASREHVLLTASS